MKYTLIAVAAALILASFSNYVVVENKPATPTVISGFQKQLNKKVWPWYYWNYIGEDHNYFHQQDPYYYVLDETPFPDCMNTMGHTICCIKAAGDAWVEGIPDMNTIQSKWYRPL